MRGGVLPRKVAFAADQRGLAGRSPWQAGGRPVSGWRRAAPAPGFSLLELLIVISMSGIILAIGIPSFQTLIVSNRLSAAANAYVSGFNEARLEAIRRNRATQFCSNSSSKNGSDVLGNACDSAAGAAYILSADGTSATKLYEAPELPEGLSLGTGTSAVAALRYNAQGFARAAVGGTGPFTGLLLDLSSSSVSTNNRRCLYLTTGSIVSSCTVTNSGGCPSSEPASCQR